MAVGTTVAVHVDSADLYKTGHMVNRWFRSLALHLEEAITLKAPMRSGELKGSITSDVTRVGEHQITALIGSSAPYAIYVLQGTDSPIYTTLGFAAGIGQGRSWVWVTGRYGPMKQRQPGYWMPLAAYGPYPKKILDVVSGQKANNFFAKGWVAASRRHRVLRDRGIPAFIINP